MILVAGATGQLGSVITRRLLDEGKQVRILVRPGSNYQPLVEAGAEPILGDLKQAESLKPAVTGVQTVISTATSTQRGGDDTVQSVDLEGIGNLIEAAKEAGVRQFIFISIVFADANSTFDLARAKGINEDRLRASGMAYTIIPINSLFVENWMRWVVGNPAFSGEPVQLNGEGKHKHSFMTIDDITSFVVATIDHPDAMNQRLIIGGPEPISWRDVIAAYENELNHSLEVKIMPPGTPLPYMTARTPDQLAILMGLVQMLETMDTYMDASETVNKFGVKPMTLAQMVHREVAMKTGKQE